MEEEENFNIQETIEPNEWNNKITLNQLCRVCANHNNFLITIFDGEGVDHELGMKINKHLPIQVFEEDDLPKQICYQCASTLIAWHDLVITCISADKRIRQLHGLVLGDAAIEEKPSEFYGSIADPLEQVEDDCLEHSSSLRLLPLSQVEREPKKVPQSRSELGKESNPKQSSVTTRTSTSASSLLGTAVKSFESVEVIHQKKESVDNLASSERSLEHPSITTVRKTEVLGDIYSPVDSIFNQRIETICNMTEESLFQDVLTSKLDNYYNNDNLNVISFMCKETVILNTTFVM